MQPLNSDSTDRPSYCLDPLHFPHAGLPSLGQGLGLHHSGLLQGGLVVQLLAGAEMHIPDLGALSPGGHPIFVFLGAFPGILDLLHLPEVQILQAGHVFEAKGFGQG